MLPTPHHEPPTPSSHRPKGADSPMELARHTVYFQNLDDHLRKSVLREQLWHLCIPFGRIVDVVAVKTAKMRGQAFVTFADAASAQRCQHQLSGVHFFGKPVRTALAHKPSRKLLLHRSNSKGLA